MSKDKKLPEQLFPSGSMVMVDRKIKARIPDKFDFAATYQEALTCGILFYAKMTLEEYIKYWEDQQKSRVCVSCMLMKDKGIDAHLEYDLIVVDPVTNLDTERRLYHVCENTLKLAKKEY